MANKYNSLEDFRKRKEALKTEITDLENILTFDNAKESLSAFTGGFTDPFLKEEVDENGETSVSFDSKNIIQSLTGEVKKKINKNSMRDAAKSDIGSSIVENAIKLAIVAFVTNYTKKSLYNANWKKKLIGLAIVYVAPYFLRMIRAKLENFQKNRSFTSMEQLI